MTADSPERRIVIVELDKDTDQGIGMTIVGGENTGKLDLGIFVKSVIPGGPAAADGRVRAGDRIIAINGHSLEGMPHHVAVELIRDAPALVQLVISQQASAPTSPTSPSLAHPLMERESSPSIDGVNIENVLNAGGIVTRSGRRYSPHHGEGLGSRRGDGQELAQPRPTNPDLYEDDMSSANSSDLELENVVPPEALKSDYPRHHMTYSPAGQPMGRVPTSGGLGGARQPTAGRLLMTPKQGILDSRINTCILSIFMEKFFHDMSGM